MNRADIRTETEELQQVLENGDVFVEEQNRGRIIRLSTEEVIWEFTSKESNLAVGMPKWSRYLTVEQVKNVLPILESTDCF